LALDTHIFVMTAIVVGPAAVTALVDSIISRSASEVIQENGTFTSPVRVAGDCSLREAQLSASSVGIIGCKMVVTDGAPAAIMVDFQPTTGAGTTAKAERAFFTGWFLRDIAHNTHIFVMTAVVAAPTSVLALIKPLLFATATKIIHNNGAFTSPVRVDFNCVFAWEAHLVASGSGVIVIETVIANAAPLATVVHLKPTAATIGAIAEAEIAVGKRNALNAHIFVMTAIVGAPTKVSALIDPIMHLSASKVVKEDLA
jgi:hypothetical protein